MSENDSAGAPVGQADGPGAAAFDYASSEVGASGAFVGSRPEQPRCGPQRAALAREPMCPQARSGCTCHDVILFPYAAAGIILIRLYAVTAADGNICNILLDIKI